MYTRALSLVPTTALAEVIARGLGASATLSAAARQLFEKLAKRVKKKKHEYKNDDLVSIAWAFGQLKLESPKLFDILGYRTIQTENLPPDQVSKLLWAFGRLSHMAPVIFQALGSRLKATLDEYSASQAASAACRRARERTPERRAASGGRRPRARAARPSRSSVRRAGVA